MHRSLRVGGLLVDSHPVAEPSPTEVRTSAGSTRVGQLEYTSEFEETISNAEGTLALLGRQGVFERQRSVDYQFLIHFESAAQWQEYFEYWASYYEPLPAGLMQSIEDLASVPGTEFVLDTKCQSTTFKKLG